jgi:anti-sigma regulatory factor (Ser/Thr protein kinase)
VGRSGGGQGTPNGTIRCGVAGETMTARTLRCAPDTRASPQARMWLRVFLADHGFDDDLTEDVLVVASELVTNAVLHGAGDVTIHVDVDASRLRIAVRDAGEDRVRLRAPRVDDLTGRGLPLVAYLSARWGVDPQVEGKTVWAELELATRP